MDVSYLFFLYFPIFCLNFGDTDETTATCFYSLSTDLWIIVNVFVFLSSQLIVTRNGFEIMTSHAFVPSFCTLSPGLNIIEFLQLSSILLQFLRSCALHNAFESMG